MARIIEVRNYFDPLFSYLHRYTQLRKEELLQVVPFLEISMFEKKSIILHEGEIDNYLNIVMKGMVRKYIVLSKKEVTLQLATEGHLVHSEISFNTRTPSEVWLQAVEPSILVRVDHIKLETIMQQYPWAETIGRLLVTKLAASKERRLYNIRMKTPRQRFIEYVERHPHMLQRVPQNILASYLNINPATFSRLKHLLVKR